MNDSAADWEKVERLFHLASELPPAERPAFLQRECGGDAALIAEVESLLSSASAQTGVALVDRGVNLADPNPTGPDVVAGTLLGAYRVVRLLGRGGMGEVYLAERSDGKFNKQVAGKLLRPEAAEHLARFEAERQILARLEHPGIAQLLDSGSLDDGRQFILMEYVPGRPLLEYARAEKLDLAARLRLFMQICDAVAFAHTNLVVHRDLKSGNVLVTAGGQAKLLDFGVAKLLESGFGDSGATVAPLTPDHAAPEQLLGKPVTTTTDVYALGVVLYELLTGASPWAHLKALPMAQALPRLLEDEPKLVSAAAAQNPQAPVPARALAGDLDAIVAKALRKKPADRYASVADFARDLQRQLDGEPVLARPAGTWYRLSRFAWRNRCALRLSAALAVVAIGAWQWVLHQRAAREREITIEKIVEKGRLELLDGCQARAAVYLNEAYKMGYDTVPLRFMLHQAMLPVDALTNVRVHHEGYGMYRGATFSPDGKQFVLGAILEKGGQRRAVMKIYDAATGKQVSELPDAPQLPLLIEYLPDGKHFLMTGYADEYKTTPPSTYIWNLETPAAPVRIEGINGMTGQPVSADGAHVIIVGKTGVEVHDAQNGALLSTLARGREIRAATYSPDGRFVAFADARGTLQIESFDGVGSSRHLLTARLQNVVGILYSPDGQRLLALSDLSDVRIWDATSGELLIAFAAAGGQLSEVSFSRDGRRLLTIGTEGYKVWSAARGVLVFAVPVMLNPLASAAISPDGDELITASDSSAVPQVWDVRSRRLLYSLDLHSAQVSGATYDPAGKRLLLASRDGQAEIWGMPIKPAWKYESFESLPRSARFEHATGMLFAGGGDARHGSLISLKPGSADARRLSTDNRAVIDELALSRREDLLATASLDGTAGIWTLNPWRRVAQLDHGAPVSNVRFSTDGQRVLTMSDPAAPDQPDAVGLWNAMNGQLIARLGHQGLVYDARFDSAGHRVVTAGVDKLVKIWDAESGALLRTLAGHAGRVRSAEFSGDGHRILTAGEDSTLRIWDTETGNPVEALADPGLGTPTGAVFSPSERLVAAPTESGNIYLWRPGNDKPRVLKGHDQQVNGVRFSADDALLFSYGEDGTARVWGTANATELATIAIHPRQINSLDVDFDLERVATVSWGRIEVSDVQIEKRLPAEIEQTLQCSAPWIFDPSTGTLKSSSAGRC